MPYQVTLIDHDGQRFSAVVDITRSKVGKSHDGYEDISGLKLTREAPPKAPPKAEVALGGFLMTQSGGLMPEGYGNKPVAMFPPGFTDHVEVMALDPAGVHRTARFDVDERGMVRPDPKQPALGNLKFRLSTTDAEGHRYSADIDIQRGRVGASHVGWEPMKDIKLALTPAPASSASERALDGVAGDFAKQQGAPKTGMSPLQLLLQR